MKKSGGQFIAAAKSKKLIFFGAAKAGVRPCCSTKRNLYSNQPFRAAMWRSRIVASTVIGTLPPSTTASLKARKS